MKHRSTDFETRQRPALKGCAGNSLNSRGAPPRVLDFVMR
jgi:hypothetical protein